MSRIAGALVYVAFGIAGIAAATLASGALAQPKCHSSRCRTGATTTVPNSTTTRSTTTGATTTATTTTTTPTALTTPTTTTTPTPATTAATTTSTTPVPPGTPVAVGPLMFGDEFNGAAGSQPSTALWGGKNSFTTNALSGARMDGWNQISEDGNGDLVITARKDPTSGQWITGHMWSVPTYSGPRYMEVRARMAAGYGAWNAPLWEQPLHGGQENDVNEQLGRQPNTFNATLHNWSVSPQRQKGLAISTGVDLSSGFHTYGAAVYHDHIDYYFDGAKVGTINASDVGLTDLTTTAENAWVTLNIGGGWAGTPTIPGPTSMRVDYVKVYALAS